MKHTAGEPASIQDVVFNSLAGTFQCYVYAITPVAAASVLSMVQDTINNTVAYPLSGTALNPDLVGISLETTITMVAGSSQTDQSTAISQAIQAAANYINNLAIGDPLIINDISAAIQASSSKIQDVGTPNHMLDAIYIWRSRADGSTYSRTLLTDYTPALGERLVVAYRSISRKNSQSRPGIHRRSPTFLHAPASPSPVLFLSRLAPATRLPRINANQFICIYI